MDLDPAALQIGALKFIIVVLSLSFHEWGHAFVADRLGDDTPRSEGRVTIYPPAHIDLLGTIILPLLGALGFFGSFGIIGWAKPVYINPDNFKRRTFDEALVTLAGPAMNFFLAFVGTLILILARRFGSEELVFFGRLMIGINVGLFVFNLLPIPPLDGSKFLMYWFGMSRETYAQLAFYGGFALLLIINVPGFGKFFSFLAGIAAYPFGAMVRVFA
jgi:Zn-dependent protease